MYIGKHYNRIDCSILIQNLVLKSANLKTIIQKI